MGASIRTFINNVPEAVLRDYFDQYPVEFNEPFDWDLTDKDFNKALEKAIKDLPKSVYEPIYINIERIDAMACEQGINALLDASKNAEELEKQFKEMDNDHHRAMVVFLSSPELFKTAEELLFVDYQAYGRSWQHCSIQTENEIKSISDDEANAFAYGVANVFYRNFDNADECCGEVYRRFSDGTIQISVYINDLPNSNIQVKEKELHRVNTRQAIVAAIVYDPETKHIATVAKGGKKRHDQIRQVFGETILKEDAEFVQVKPRRFKLDRFAERPKAPLLETIPEHRIEKVRVRALDLFSNAPHPHILSIDTFAQGMDSDIYQNRAVFDENGRLYSKYSINHVRLSFHLSPEKPGKKGRPIHVSLKKEGSDLKSLKEDDRQMIEGYLSEWGLIEGEEPEWQKTGTNG